MNRIKQLIRPELLKLKPYSSARDDFHGQADVFVDANENPFGNLVNRYPDPLQRQLKSEIAGTKNVDEDCIFLGNGSDEVLDLIQRLFCIPGKDEIIITPPTYGMYKVLAGINNIYVTEVNLSSDFQLNRDEILKRYERPTKVLFLCTPNNPAGNLLHRNDVLHLVDHFPGIVVIDEAYIDFTDNPGYLDLINLKPNLIVTQTLSKAWGLAGIRLGMAFANPYIIQQLNKIKPPYNVNVLTQNMAIEKLRNPEDFRNNLKTIRAQKERLTRELTALKQVRKVHDSEANFLLVEFDDADYYYQFLMERGVIVRNRSKQLHCENCLRITIGTPAENNQLLQILNQ